MQSQDNQPPGNSEATLIAPRAQQGVARLILRRPDGQLQEFGLDKDEFTIGRLSTGDLVLQDDRSVSRRHAVIRRSNTGYVIEDLQSNNGTYVDGERVEYPVVLRNGQSIKVGDNELTFKIISAPLSAGASSGPAAGMPAQMPAEPPAPTFDLPVPGAGQAPAFQPGVNPPPQPGFPPSPLDAPAQPTFGAPTPAFGGPPAQPAFGGPPAQPAFGGPPAFGTPPQPAFDAPPAPAFNAPLPPAGSSPQGVPGQPAPFGGPPQGFPPPAPFGAPPPQGFPPQPAPPGVAPTPVPSGSAASGPSGMITCHSCGQLTPGNKAFCLNCGTNLQVQQQAAPGGPPPFGAPPAPGGFAPNPFNVPPAPDAPPAWQPLPPAGQPLGGPVPGPQGWPPVPGPQAGPPAWQPPQVGGPPPGQPFGGPPPGQPFGGPPAGGPPAWQPPQPGGPPPGQPFGGPLPQGQFAPPGAAPGVPQGGPVEAVALYSRGMRPMQTSDIVVRLTTQFPAPGPLQPGMQVSVRVWPTAPDALFLGGPGVTLRVPGPGQVEEMTIKVTPLRETPRGLTDQILFQLNDAASGQPLHPMPVVAEVVISQQPVPQFDGPGSIRLPV
jgi:hypothetical protein